MGEVSGRSKESKGFSGTPGPIRTADLLLRRQTLYPAELRAHNYRLPNCVTLRRSGQTPLRSPTMWYHFNVTTIYTSRRGG
jgi:hypothetical protein